MNFILDLCKSMLSTIKDFFKIGSPSKLMNKEVGRWIPAGMAVGIESNIDSVTDAMDELSNESFGVFDTGTLAMSTSAVVSSSNNNDSSKAFANSLDTFGNNLIDAIQNLTVQANIDGDDVFENMRVRSKQYKEQTNKLAFA